MSAAFPFRIMAVRAWRSAAALMCLIMLPSACASRPLATGVSAPPTATVTVSNQDIVDVRVFAALETGERWPLGYLRAQGSESFTLPRALRLPSDIQIVGIAVATREVRTTEFARVLGGERFVVALAPPGSLSSLLKLR